MWPDHLRWRAKAPPRLLSKSLLSSRVVRREGNVDVEGRGAGEHGRAGMSRRSGEWAPFPSVQSLWKVIDNERTKRDSAFLGKMDGRRRI